MQKYIRKYSLLSIKFLVKTIFKIFNSNKYSRKIIDFFYQKKKYSVLKKRIPEIENRKNHIINNTFQLFFCSKFFRR